MRMTSLLSLLLAGLLMVLCQPSLAVTEQSGYLSAPDAVLAVQMDSQHESVGVLSADSERPFGVLGKSEGAGLGKLQTSAYLSSGGTTVTGGIANGIFRHSESHERIRSG